MINNDLISKILELKKIKSILPHTLYLLGQCYQNLNDFTNAINTYNNFISKYPNHFLTPRVYESLAITYELAGEKENARNVYDKLNILYPGSYWSNLAQQKLTASK
jgi:TolA-binding protein